jgi:hypothetical protein
MEKQDLVKKEGKIELPIMLIRNMAWAIDMAGVEICKIDASEDVVGNSFIEVIINVLKRHPEPIVGAWVISELRRIQKEEKDESLSCPIS